ncbi:cytochrome P450 2J4-like [Alexandromys fortis]|uniref:cytochrome P450 2J4-like n=1 Tax=Alexandromys fortis TaxID=100897 RepID=UPI002152970D|nr:cytochrome P450 2J4-like [Microtus fortis]
MLATVGSLVTSIWAVLHIRTLLLAVVTSLFLADYLKRRHPKKFPPGPRRLPFVGNLLQKDMEKPHVAVQQDWSSPVARHGRSKEGLL